MADTADMADFQVPQSSLPQLTASIGAMARYNGRELPAAADSRLLPMFPAG